MKNTSLCYIENDGKYLMLHRVKKENDANKDKWSGIGGKFEDKESPQDCALREIREETGLLFRTEELRYRGIVTFVSDMWETEYMHLFTADVTERVRAVSAASEKNTGSNSSGSVIRTPSENDEGVLEWVEKEKITELPIWEGDKVFLNLLNRDIPFFSLKLVYEGEKLMDSILY